MKPRGKSNSSFKSPKQVLVFNHTRILVGIIRSMMTASELTGASLKAVSSACQGSYITTAGLYFRRLHPDILIETTDLDTLRLEEYDSLCNETRRYLPKEQVKALRTEFKKAHGYKKSADDQSPPAPPFTYMEKKK